MPSSPGLEPLRLYGGALARDAALARRCDEAPAHAAWADSHLTLGQFVDQLDRRLLSGGHAPHKVVEGAARYAVLEAAWHAAARGDEPGPARRRGTKPGANEGKAREDTAPASDEGPTRAGVEALGALIAAWKGAGLDPAAVRRAAELLSSSHPRPAERMQFVARAYADYERRLGEDWTDQEGRERAVLERLRAAGRAPEAVLAAGRAVRVEGLLRLTPFRRELLVTLRGFGHPIEIAAAVPLGRAGVGPPGAPPGASFLAESFGDLVPRPDLPARRGEIPSPLVGEGSGVRGTLGSPSPGPSGHPNGTCSPLPPGERVGGASAARVKRMEAPTPYAEVYEIGRRVRGWLGVGLAAERIAVAFRDLGPFSQAISDVFRRMNIPYYERRGEPLAFQPIVRVACAGLDAVVSGLQRQGLFRFLTAGPVDLRRLSGAADAPEAHELHQLALRARVDRFFGADAQRPAQAWRERLAAFIREQGGKDPRDARDADVLSRIVARLEELRAPRTRAAFAAAWRALWSEAGLTAAAYLESPREWEALTALDEALGEAGSGPGAETGEVSLSEFAELLSAAIAGRSVRGAAGSRAAGVRVLNLYDLQGLRFDRLVVGGLNAGVFPAVPGPDPILGDAPVTELRQAFARAVPGRGPFIGVTPRAPAEAFEEERALAELARRAAGEELLLTRSRRSGGGEVASPSIFWEEFAEAGELPEATDSIRPAPALEKCLSGEEAELRAAWVLGGGGPAQDQEREAERSLAVAAATPPAGRMRELAQRACRELQRADFFKRVSETRAAEPDAPLLRIGGSYDGVVAASAPEAPAALCRRFVRAPGSDQPSRADTLSPSALETLAACPFRFLAERVYRVAEPERPDEELSPLGRGSLWHEILGGFYADLLREARDGGRVVVVLEARRQAEYRRSLWAQAARSLDAAPGRFFTGHPGLWRTQRERLEAGLDAWLRYELRPAKEAEAFRPAAVELNFGPEPGAAPAVELVVATPDGEVKLCLGGRLDRLDLRLEDAAAGTPCVTGLRLIDYKTSDRDSLRELVKEEVIEALLNAQLPVYLAAAVGFLKEREARDRWRVAWDRVWRSAEAAYYALRELPAANRSGKEVLIACEKWPLPFAEFLRADGGEKSLRGLVSARLAALRDGRFPVAPLECGGRFCPARSICRYRDLPETGEGGGETGGEG